MSGESFRTLHELRQYHDLSSQTYKHLPRVQHRDVELLRRGLDGRDLLVRRGLPQVVVRDMSEGALADEVAGLGLELVDVALELVPERERVRRVCGLLDDRGERVLGDARNDLRETEGLVVHEVTEDLNGKGAIALA